MKKNLMITTILILAGILAACSLPFSSSSRTTTQSSRSAAVTDPSKLTIETKAGIGILKLEGTELAVDAAKAKELLPLFQALKTLSANNNTAVDEINALNKQIKNTLSTEQLTAIQNMTFTSADISKSMQENGLLDASTTANTTKTTSNQGGGFGGPPDAGGIPGISGGASTTSSSRVQATPNAVTSALNARKTAGSLNLTFAEPIIKLLQSKISK